ncbi:MAG TPA: hypothetical protein VIL22_02820, partial [Paenibacillaceae bacterium]
RFREPKRKNGSVERSAAWTGKSLIITKTIPGVCGLAAGFEPEAGKPFVPENPAGHPCKG